MFQSRINKSRHEILIKKFGDVRVSDPFFDSFRQYYEPYYSEWVKRKTMDPVYVVEEHNVPIAFMKLKIENENEDYTDITPVFRPAKRLKICSFKVAWGNYELSKKMIEIAISVAILNNVTEIYGTIPSKCHYKWGLVNFLKKYKFKKSGIKESHGIVEEVYFRPVTI